MVVLFLVFKRHLHTLLQTSLIAQLVKNLPAVQETRFNYWVGKICWRRDMLPTPVFLGFPCGSAGKESTSNVGDLSSVPGLGWSPEGKGYPLQYSCLVNPMDRTAYSPWGGNSQTWLSKWSEVAQSCPTLCDPMDCSLPGSSLGLWDFPARKLEWLAISFSMTEQAHMLLIMD